VRPGKEASLKTTSPGRTQRVQATFTFGCLNWSFKIQLRQFYKNNTQRGQLMRRQNDIPASDANEQPLKRQRTGEAQETPSLFYDILIDDIREIIAKMLNKHDLRSFANASKANTRLVWKLQSQKAITQIIAALESKTELTRLVGDITHEEKNQLHIVLRQLPISILTALSRHLPTSMPSQNSRDAFTLLLRRSSTVMKQSNPLFWSVLLAKLILDCGFINSGNNKLSPSMTDVNPVKLYIQTITNRSVGLSAEESLEKIKNLTLSPWLKEFAENYINAKRAHLSREIPNFSKDHDPTLKKISEAENAIAPVLIAPGNRIIDYCFSFDFDEDMEREEEEARQGLISAWLENPAVINELVFISEKITDHTFDAIFIIGTISPKSPISEYITITNILRHHLLIQQILNDDTINGDSANPLTDFLLYLYRNRQFDRYHFFYDNLSNLNSILNDNKWEMHTFFKIVAICYVAQKAYTREELIKSLTRFYDFISSLSPEAVNLVTNTQIISSRDMASLFEMDTTTVNWLEKISKISIKPDLLGLAISARNRTDRNQLSDEELSLLLRLFVEQDIFIRQLDISKLCEFISTPENRIWLQNNFESLSKHSALTEQTRFCTLASLPNAREKYDTLRNYLEELKVPELSSYSSPLDKLSSDKLLLALLLPTQVLRHLVMHVDEVYSLSKGVTLSSNPYNINHHQNIFVQCMQGGQFLGSYVAEMDSYLKTKIESNEVANDVSEKLNPIYALAAFFDGLDTETHMTLARSIIFDKSDHYKKKSLVTFIIQFYQLVLQRSQDKEVIRLLFKFMASIVEHPRMAGTLNHAKAFFTEQKEMPTNNTARLFSINTKKYTVDYVRYFDDVLKKLEESNDAGNTPAQPRL